jgi:hypothetical protein
LLVAQPGAPLSSLKANLVLPYDTRTVHATGSLGWRIHSTDASVSLERQIMTPLSRFERRLRSDMNQTVILPFVGKGTLRRIMNSSQTTLSNI